ncbi:MAG: type IV secretion system protein [Pseudomonadota bacterium]
MSAEGALEAYFTEAQSWDQDRVAQTRRVAHLAFASALAGWVVAIGLAVALAGLMPLKSVEPFVVRVDNTTGVVDVVPAYAGASAYQEPVTRYLLTHYVRICEGYTAPSAESDYEECGAFNTAERNQEWYALWNPTNPQSPLNQYRDGTTAQVRVTSVSFFKRSSSVEDLAQVRYLVARRVGGAGAEQVSHFIATIQFAYAAPSKNPKTRQWNPLGLRVVSFRRESEVPEVTSVKANDAGAAR